MTHFGEKKHDFTKVQYLPAINAKPSDMSTVYTTLKRGQQLARTLGRKNNVHTMNQQLYAVGQVVKFVSPEDLDGTVITMSDFHTINVFTSCIKILWGDCGLLDMLVESGVYAASTADQMLEGRQYHRAMRGLTLCYEVLLTMLFENFLEDLFQTNVQHFHELRDMFTKFYSQFSEGLCTKENWNELIDKSRPILMVSFNNFRREKASKSLTFKFWGDGLQCLQMLLQLRRSNREGDWKLNMSSLASMLPYFFVCNKPNYSRWSPFYVLDMTLNLPEEIQKEFMDGNFPVRFTPGSFRGLPRDVATEMSVIKDTKSASGILGQTSKESTIIRWTVTRNILGLFTSALLDRSGISQTRDNDEYVHESEHESEISRDERHFNMILSYTKNHMCDPFSPEVRSDVLKNISTGLVASKETQNFLSNIQSIGFEKLEEFVVDRLEESSGDLLDKKKTVLRSHFSDYAENIQRNKEKDSDENK
ncbi:hypothetical protein QAD02_021859 [Eretmocerus hayati]|uniref:Uncharacterized protein n=1 Tax=Eretmocerus hayati TaxID=131215 RepID=A0ACC2PR26_9HYME|nr:hypothetical protein QAD02_021859 [Eretmocerus hayati]